MPPNIQHYPLPHWWNFSLLTTVTVIHVPPMCSQPLAVHSGYDDESVERAVDLNACTAIGEYEQKDASHGMGFICDENE